MTREEFISSYCERSRVSWDELSKTQLVVPCECDQEGCQGWVMVSKTPKLPSKAAQEAIEEIISITRRGEYPPPNACCEIIDRHIAPERKAAEAIFRSLQLLLNMPACCNTDKEILENVKIRSDAKNVIIEYEKTKGDQK
jgi:plasmid stabilization system protein ParE